MSDISWTVFVLGILNSVLITFMNKKVKLFLLIVSSWWFFWLFVSTFSLSGLYIPELNTYYLFVGMILSITMGGFIYLLIKRDKKNHSNNCNTSNSFPSSYSWTKKIYFANYFVAFPIILFLFQKAIRFYIANPLALSEGYRTAVYKDDILFPSLLFELLFNLIISPIPFTSLFIGVAIYVLKDDLHLFIISSLLLSMQSIMMGGRFNLYTIIVLYIIMFFMKNNYSFLFILNFLKTLRKNYKSMIIVIIAVLFLYNITLARAKLVTQDQIFNKYIIDYHTLGFVLFDNELQNSQSLLNKDKTYGRASLGTIERLVVLILRRFDRTIDSSATQIGGNLDEMRVLGRRDSKPLYYNAFGTVLYSIYRDGGLFLSLLLPMIYGFFLAKFSFQARIRPCEYNIAILLALIYLGIFGIFQPLLVSNYWLFIIYINMFVPAKNYSYKSGILRRNNLARLN